MAPTIVTSPTKIPALIIQPMIENCIRHALAFSSRPIRITITARRDGDMLAIDLDNDGPSAATAGDTGLGLRNVELRLAARYDRHASFRLRPLPGAGMRNEIRLPCKVLGRQQTAMS